VLDELDAFGAAVDAYADFQWAHKTKEEQEVLPLAEIVLQPEDWAHIDAAFSSNDDPLVGVGPQKEFRALFRAVVNAMPAPMGLGPERRRVGRRRALRQVPERIAIGLSGDQRADSPGGRFTSRHTAMRVRRVTAST
jgi:hypothetical protein